MEGMWWLGVFHHKKCVFFRQSLHVSVTLCAVMMGAGDRVQAGFRQMQACCSCTSASAAPGLCLDEAAVLKENECHQARSQAVPKDGVKIPTHLPPRSACDSCSRGFSGLVSRKCGEALRRKTTPSAYSVGVMLVGFGDFEGDCGKGGASHRLVVMALPTGNGDSYRGILGGSRVLGLEVCMAKLSSSSPFCPFYVSSVTHGWVITATKLSLLR